MRELSPPRPCHLLSALVFVSAALACRGQGVMAAESIETGFVSKVYHDAQGDHRYVVWVPHEYDPQRPWPVMLFLHGAGQRGTDGLAQIRFGLGPLISRWGGFPWIVVFPQAENQRIAIEKAWSPDSPDGRRALAILEQVEKNYHTDPNHRVLTGWSMGGHGCYQIAAGYPKMWSAVVPVSGWGDPTLAESLTDVPIWAFHGTDDSLVPIETDRALIEAIERAGGDPLFTELAGRGHSIWRSVYACGELFRWMSNPDHIEGGSEPPACEPLPDVEMSAAEAKGPFTPEILVRNAVVLHLGQDVFADFSRLASEEFGKTPFQGTLPGRQFSSSAMGVAFDVRTSGGRYRVPVLEVQIEPTSHGTLLLRARIANARATIWQTHLEGLLCSAEAGPITIWLAHRRPLLIEAEVVPELEGRSLTVETRNVTLNISPDNWWVSPPSVTSTLLPDQKVAQSMVAGIYAKRDAIETALKRAIATALESQTFRLPQVSQKQLLTGLWPMPAYRPRARPRLTGLSIDETGVCAHFDLLIAAIDPYAKLDTRMVDFGLTNDDVQEGSVAIEAAGGLLRLLSHQLIATGVAHINVLDVPETSFGDLADRQVLAKAIPAIADLPPGAQLRTELYLRQPLELSLTRDKGAGGGRGGENRTSTNENSPAFPDSPDPPSPNGAQPRATRTEEKQGHLLYDLIVPDLVAVISRRRGPQDPWREWAEIHYTIRQSVRLDVGLALRHGREVISIAARGPLVRATGNWLGPSPADSRIDEAAAAEMFRERWMQWWSPSEPTAIVIPDLTFAGYTRRLDRLVPADEGLVAIFEKPTTVITNRSHQPLTYRIRRPDGLWSEQKRLPPGAHHLYHVSRDLAYRSRVSGETERYDIPAGRDASYRRGPEGRAGLVLEPLPQALEVLEQIPGTGSPTPGSLERGVGTGNGK